MTPDRTRPTHSNFRKGKTLVLPPSSAHIRLLPHPTNSSKMDLAARTAMKEAILKLPDTQTREIFSVAYPADRAHIPFIRLPDSETPRNDQQQDEEESDDTDVEDVEELFLELAQELDSEDKATQQRLTRVAKDHHQSAPPTAISLPQSVFTFPSSDYFSPGAPFLTSTGSPMTPQPEKRRRTSVLCTPTPEPDPPTISVRIAGGDIIQDVFLSPIVERPPSSPQRTGWERESYQTRSDEELMHSTHPFSLRPPPHLMRSRRQSRTTQQSERQTPPADGLEARSQASSKNSSTSAVSPRFMALRKLSESGLITPYAKPPPPPPPPTAHSSSENSSVSDGLNEQRLIDRIDELIETRLKTNMSEILWRATESHRDARRFWEEQRRDMLELGASILHRLSNQSVKKEEGVEEEQELDTLRKLRIDLENEVSGYQLKEIAQQSEIQSLQHRNKELEKEMDLYRERNAELEEQLSRLTKVAQDRLCVTETRDVQTEEITETVEWADLVADEEWADKYRELESRYDAATAKIAHLESQLASVRLSMPTGSATPTPTPAMIKQRKHKSMTPVPSAKERKASHRQSYFMNEEGQLTFTTEINGRLSQFTVKVPGKEDVVTPASPPSKLNPLAPAWKAPSPTTMST
ncbi:hypothetical protein BJV82DRAFT_595516 [Fennellomyces sp. T-0311]|nr:hypothetical protein BJV82DRAFT_595516 [Fennellomyces sp. T-0311]